LKYGVNFGGVIDMTTYQPVFYQQYKTKVKALLGAQTNHAGAKTKVAVSGGNRFFAYNLSGSWKKYNDYQDGNENWVPAALQQQTLTGNLGFKLAGKHIIYATSDFSLGRNIDFPTLSMDERNDNTAIYSLNYFSEQINHSIHFIRVKAYYSNVHHEMDNKNRPFSDTVVAVSSIHAVNAGAKAGVSFTIGKGNLETGGDYENIYKNGTRLKTMILQPMLPTKVEDLWNNARINNIGIFAEYDLPGAKLDWTIAARIDLNEASSGPLMCNNMAGDAIYLNDSTESSYMNFSFSAGLEWHLGKSSKLFFSLGRGTRSPDMTERFIILLPTGYDPYDYLGNPQLKPEVNHELDLGYKLTKTNTGNFDLSGFFSFVSNYISSEYVPPSEVKPQTKGVLGVKRFINIEQAYLMGGEFTYSTPQQFLWEVNLNMAYTMGWNPSAEQQVFENGQVVGIVTINNDPLPEIPPFETFVSFNYKLFNRKFVPSVSIRWAAEQTRVSAAYNEKTSPAFILFNIDLSYQFNQNLKIFGGIKNLFNTAYYEHLNRSIIDTQYPLYEPGIVFYGNLIFNF
jgi:iron complex outermembrane receptor protein